VTSPFATAIISPFQALAVRVASVAGVSPARAVVSRSRVSLILARSADVSAWKLPAVSRRTGSIVVAWAWGASAATPYT
jgi:hypothetical protein